MAGEQIRHEIQRFESVHPAIYALYDLIDLVHDPILQQQLRHHVVAVEDSFVNSQEWTLSRSVSELRLGVVGSLNSGKSALVHRYLTGTYLQEESPEGGRFKKEIILDGQSHLLMIRDEGGSPDRQFAEWCDAVMFVFALENEASYRAIYHYYAKFTQYRDTSSVPIILVGTQDLITQECPRTVEESLVKRLANDLTARNYYETCATYGLNVDKVFREACSRIIQKRQSVDLVELPIGSCPATPHGSSAAKYNHFYAPSPVNASGLTPSRSCSSLNKDDELPSTPQATPQAQRKTRRISNIFKREDRSANNLLRNGGLLEFGQGRTIPQKQGWLAKRSGKGISREWKKKYIALYPDGRLVYYGAMKDFMEDKEGKEIFLGHVTVKLPHAAHLRTNITPQQLNNHHDDSTADPNFLNDDMDADDPLNASTSTVVANPLNFKKIKPTKGHQRKGSNLLKSPESGEESPIFQLVSLDGRSWEFEAASGVERDAWMAEIQAAIMKVLQATPGRNGAPAKDFGKLKQLPGNSVCADCGAADPSWASLNLGTLVCIECSGAHRKLGTHLSRIRSLDLDEFPAPFLSIMEKLGGNAVVNRSLWEARLPVGVKPPATATRMDKERFIVAKYQEKRWAQPIQAGHGTLAEQICNAVTRRDLSKLQLLLVHALPTHLNAFVHGQTALHAAAQASCAEAVQMLLWKDADPAAKDACGRSAAWYGENSRCEITKRLLSNESREK